MHKEDDLSDQVDVVKVTYLILYRGQEVVEINGTATGSNLFLDWWRYLAREGEYAHRVSHPSPITIKIKGSHFFKGVSESDLCAVKHVERIHRVTLC